MRLKWFLVLAIIVSVCAGAQETANKPAQTDSAPSRCPGIAKFPQRSSWQIECSGPYAVPGHRCLVFPDVVMHGTVTDAGGEATLVVDDPRSPNRRAYFLHQHDELYNGRIVEITEKSVVLCEFVSDRQGNASTPHETTFPITRKPNPSVAENTLPAQPQPVGMIKGTRTSCTSGPFSGAKYNFHLQDLDVTDFFRLMHHVANLNFIADSGLKGRITLDAQGMPLDEAVAVAMRNSGLECELWNNVLHIATVETLKSQAERVSQDQGAGCVPDNWHGASLKLDLKDLPLSDLFRLVHEISHLTVLVDTQVKGTVTIAVTDQTWDRVLDMAARSNGFRCQFEGDTLRILSAK